MEEFDVAVIGAGLAGLHCARRVARAGWRVLLVDRKRSLGASVHTTGIFVRRTLADFDLPEDCLGPPVRKVTLYSPRRRPLVLESPFDEFRVGRMRELYARYLDQCLAAGVEWRPGTRYAGIDLQRPEKTLLRLESSGCETTTGVRYVVGADGAKSSIARDLGLDENQEWIVGVEEVYRGLSRDVEPRFHCFIDPVLAPGYLAWLVNDGVEMHLGVGGYPERFDPKDALSKFRASVGDIVDLGRAPLLETRGGRIPVGGVLGRIANSRGLLVGDAAGAVSPLTAGGLDPCLRLSELAGRVIEEFLSTGDEARLAPYSGRRFRSRFTSRLWMRRILSGMRRPAPIELACAALRTPILKPLAWHVFFGRGSFPDSESMPLNSTRQCHSPRRGYSIRPTACRAPDRS